MGMWDKNKKPEAFPHAFHRMLIFHEGGVLARGRMKANCMREARRWRAFRQSIRRNPGTGGGLLFEIETQWRSRTKVEFDSPSGEWVLAVEFEDEISFKRGLQDAAG